MQDKINFYKEDAQEMRMPEIKRNKRMSATSGLLYKQWKVKWDAAKQWEKFKYASEKRRLEN